MRSSGSFCKEKKTYLHKNLLHVQFCGKKLVKDGISFFSDLKIVELVPKITNLEIPFLKKGNKYHDLINSAIFSNLLVWVMSKFKISILKSHYWARAKLFGPTQKQNWVLKSHYWTKRRTDMNSNWQVKCSSLAPSRSIFCKTQWAWQGVKLIRLMSIFTSKKFGNIW